MSKNNANITSSANDYRKYYTTRWPSTSNPYTDNTNPYHIGDPIVENDRWIDDFWKTNKQWDHIYNDPIDQDKDEQEIINTILKELHRTKQAQKVKTAPMPSEPQKRDAMEASDDVSPALAEMINGMG